MAIPGNLLGATTEQVDPNTSGWDTRLNCTKALGGGGRNGDGCLELIADAAGEMQAATAALVPVEAGTTYFTFADASSSYQPERIGIEWLDADLGQVGVTWSLTTITAAASWHRVSVAGLCPAGAVQARVLLSSTTGAGGDLHFWENAYFGPPIRTSGNLFSFNLESGGEIDDSGWSAETNGTVSRLVPVVPWPATWYYCGGHVLALAAATDGDMAMETTEGPAVQPGVDYRAYAYLSPPSSTADCWIELRWYDAADSLLGTPPRAYIDQPDVGWLRQAVSGIAPAGASYARLAVGVDDAGASEALGIDGVVLTVAPALASGSVVPYEDASFEQGLGSWVVASGAMTVARSGWMLEELLDGEHVAVATAAAAGTTVLRSGLYPVTGGEQWRPAVGTQRISGGDWTASLALHCYDGEGVDLGTVGGVAIGIPEGTATWWVVFHDATLPPSTVAARIELSLTTTAAGVVHLDRVVLRQVLPKGEVTPQPALGLVTVILRELTPGDTITVWRLAAGGRRTLVRGRGGLIERAAVTSDVMVIEDYEAPLGVDVSYYVTYYSGSAVHGTRTIAPCRLDVADRSLMWVKDPAQPQRNLALRCASAPDWSRPIERMVHRVRGRRMPVVLTDVRGGLEGEVEVWTRTDAERAALHFALDPGHTLLMQWAPDLGLGDMYVQVGEVTEARTQGYGGDPHRRWSLPLTQVDMPTTGVSGTAGWTVQDVVATHATVQDVVDSYATVFDLALDERQ